MINIFSNKFNESLTLSKSSTSEAIDPNKLIYGKII